LTTFEKFLKTVRTFPTWCHVWNIYLS